SRAALRRLAGEGGRELREVEHDVLSCLAAIEANLDFPEDVPAPERQRIEERARGTAARLAEIIAGAERGRLLREGAMVALAGRPNVGKSSLLNAFLGEERAIVAPLPGTTRDAVAEEFSLKGIPIRLVDTAGLGEAGDALEAVSMERTRREISRADLVLLVLAGNEGLTPEDETAAEEAAACGRGIVAVNKIDLPQALQDLPHAAAGWPVVRVSALTGQGLEELAEAIVQSLGGNMAEGTPLLSRERQVQAAREAEGALRSFAAGIETGLPLDILAEDLRACLRAIGRLTGRALGPDLLREIFSQFCVGK
ncbi:MAG: tRNA modification GTPase, partial [Bacteroidota bacterium]